MSNFVVSARKYRPRRFEDVVGQEHVSKTLKNALQSDHLAQAFLFCGPRGVGKTTCARILAKILNCQNLTPEHEPCDTCDSCRAFNENASFNITELDAASNNSVEHIRSLIDQVRFQPQQGQYKVFIIDEVHMLTQAAFNAFLKTLEEPPPYAIFILATTEKHKIIPTILSRCQIFDFRRIQVPDIVSHLNQICLQENIAAEHDALHIIAQKADGALRDALSIFDRIVSFAGNKVTYDDVIANLNILDYDYFFRITDALLLEDIAQVLLVFDDILRKGFDPDLFVNGLAEHLRNLLVSKDEQTLLLLEAGDSLRERYRQQARLSPAAFLLTALNMANECDLNFKQARNKRLHTEMSLVKMASIGRAMRAAAWGEPEKKNPDLTELPAANLAVRPDPLPSRAPEGQPAPPPAQVESQPAPAPAATPAAAHLMARVDLKALMAEVKHDNQPKEEVTQISLEALQAAWSDYAQRAERESVRLPLQSAQLSVEGLAIQVRVGSKLAEGAIREESGLMDFLRAQLQSESLSLRVTVDDSLRTNDKPTPPRLLSAKDKYLMLRETNPLLEEMRKRFDLRPDED